MAAPSDGMGLRCSMLEAGRGGTVSAPADGWVFHPTHVILIEHVGADRHSNERKRPSGSLSRVGALIALAIPAIVLSTEGAAASRAGPLPGATQAALPDTTQIRKVAIVQLPVFPETTGTPLPWYLHLVNRLHRETRPSVIRQEILLREGALYDPLRASESERLLRDRGIFESVRVTSSQDGEGYVTTVRTQDLWTLAVNVTGQKQANLSSVTLDIRDTNVLGTGNGVRWEQTFSTDRRGTGASVEIPRIGSTRASFGAAYGQTDDSKSRFVAFSRPNETYFDRWCWDVAANDSRGDQRFYRSGVESGTSGYERERAVMAIGHYNGTLLQTGVGGGWIYERSSPRGTPASLVAGIPPPPAIDFTRLSGPLLYGGITQRRFVQTTNLERYGVVEDVPLGWVASVAGAANADPSRDPGHAVAIRPFLSGATILGGKEWIASAEGIGLAYVRRSGKAGERVMSTSATIRWQPSPRALSIAQISLHAVADPPRADVFYLGTDTGLRGYPARALQAQEFMTATVEQHFWSGLEVLWTGLGFDLFADAARPTMTGGENDASWRIGVGGGILLGLRKSSQPPLRIELAWRRDRAGEKPTFSVTSDTWLRLIPQVSMPSLFRDLHGGLR